MKRAEKKPLKADKANNPERNEKPAEAKKTRKKASAGRLKAYLILVIAAGIIGVVIAFVKFFGSEKVQRNASVTIEFTYDGAAQNLTPSGENFAISDIYKAEILNAAIEQAGFSGKYTAEQIRANMVVNGSYPSDVINQIKDYDSLYDFSESRSVSISNYYPTIYSIVLYDEFDTSIGKNDLKKLVNASAEQYKKYFTNEYIDAFDMDTYDNLMVLGDYDYSQQVKILKFRLELLRTYADEMYKKDASFRFSGKSFNDVSLKCREIENDALSRVEATIMMDVLTNSVSKLKNQYEYEIKLLENEKSFKTVNLEELNKLIDDYKMDGTLYIPSGDSLVKVESNSKETYEKLVDKKRELSEELVEIESEISRYNSYLEDLKSKTSSAANQAVLDELKSINNKVLEQESNFSDMMADYNSTLIQDDALTISSTRFTGSDLLSASFIVMVIKCAAPLCIIVLILCGLHGFICESKKYKKENN